MTKIFRVIKWYNYGIIQPLPEGKLAAALAREMSYEKKGIEFMPNRAWGIVKFYSSKKGTFPWGLLSTARRVFEQYNERVEPTIVDYPVKIGAPLMQENAVLRPYQVDAVNTLIANDGGILSIPTGGGKTVTAVEYLKHMKLRSTVVVTTLDIKRQWEEALEGVENVTVINYQNKAAGEAVKASDVVVFDECHHASCKTIYKLAMGGSRSAILVGLSATPYREDGEGMRLQAALGDIVYTIERSWLISRGYLSDARVVYLTAEYTPERHLTYAYEYTRYIVNNQERNELIAGIVTREAEDGKRVLVLVNHIAHGEILLGMLPGAVFLNGSVKDRSVDLSQTAVVVASSVFNEGVNLPTLDVLMLAGAGKSAIQLTQKVGRVLRASANKKQALVYDFADRGKYLGAHYKARRRLLEQEFEVEDL